MPGSPGSALSGSTSWRPSPPRSPGASAEEVPDPPAPTPFRNRACGGAVPDAEGPTPKLVLRPLAVDDAGGAPGHAAVLAVLEAGTQHADALQPVGQVAGLPEAGVIVGPTGAVAIAHATIAAGVGRGHPLERLQVAMERQRGAELPGGAPQPKHVLVPAIVVTCLQARRRHERHNERHHERRDGRSRGPQITRWPHGPF